LFFSAAEAVVGNPKVGAADSSAVDSIPEVPANDQVISNCLKKMACMQACMLSKKLT